MFKTREINNSTYFDAMLLKIYIQVLSVHITNEINHNMSACNKVIDHSSSHFPSNKEIRKSTKDLQTGLEVLFA